METSINRSKFKALSIVNLVLYLFMLTMNALANILPINGKNTGEISDSYTNLFVPAGITFSIWGIIYILLFLFTIYQIYQAFSKSALNLLPLKSMLVFGITHILNGLWILAWHYELLLLSVIIMVSLLSLLILLFTQIKQVEISENFATMAIVPPIGVYLGWISVATIANITALLVHSGWGGFGLDPIIWTIIVIFVATILTGIVIFKSKCFAYALVSIWAITGIIINHRNVDYGEQIIINFCFIAILSIILFIIISAVKSFKLRE